jgi:hypothetical protein
MDIDENINIFIDYYDFLEKSGLMKKRNKWTTYIGFLMLKIDELQNRIDYLESKNGEL